MDIQYLSTSSNKIAWFLVNGVMYGVDIYYKLYDQYGLESQDYDIQQILKSEVQSMLHCLCELVSTQDNNVILKCVSKHTSFKSAVNVRKTEQYVVRPLFSVKVGDMMTKHGNKMWFISCV